MGVIWFMAPPFGLGGFHFSCGSLHFLGEPCFSRVSCDEELGFSVLQFGCVGKKPDLRSLPSCSSQPKLPLRKSRSPSHPPPQRRTLGCSSTSCPSSKRKPALRCMWSPKAQAKRWRQADVVTPTWS